jgi:hypothetical protein
MLGLVRRSSRRVIIDRVSSRDSRTGRSRLARIINQINHGFRV